MNADPSDTSTPSRSGEKWGWLGGGLGASLWIVVLAGVHLYRGDLPTGLIALGLYAASLAALFALAPWRRPRTSMGLLLLGMVAPIIAAVALFIYHEYFVVAPEQDVPISLFLCCVWPIPLVARFWRRTWSDGER